MLCDLRSGLAEALGVLLGDDDRDPDRLRALDQRGRRVRHSLEVRDYLPEPLLNVDDDQGGPIAVELAVQEATPSAKLRWRKATRPAATVIRTRPVSCRPPKQLL